MGSRENFSKPAKKRAVPEKDGVDQRTFRRFLTKPGRHPVEVEYERMAPALPGVLRRGERRTRVLCADDEKTIRERRPGAASPFVTNLTG